MEQGTGKTLTVLDIITERHRRCQVDLVIVLCPLSVLPVWVREIHKHVAVEHRVVTSWEMFEEYRLRFRRGQEDTLTFVVMNYEHARTRIKKMVRENYDAIIADEGHKIRNRDSAQSRAARRLARRSDYRFVLTGTPVGKDEIDLWAQMDFLDPDILGTFKQFKSRYLRSAGFMGKQHQIKSKTSRKKMLKAIKPFTYRVTKDQVLKDLPPFVDQELWFDLDKKHRRLYDKLREDSVVELNEGEIVAGLEITVAIKLHQMSGGWVKNDDGDTVEVGKSKLKLFEEFITDRPWANKVVIFTMFKAEMDAICEILKKQKLGYLVLRGGRKKEKSAGQVEKEFHEDPSKEVLVCQIQAGAAGLDFTPADMAIYYSLTRSWLDYDQSRARLHRNGQTRPVTYIHLLGQNTVDETILSALKEKHDIAKYVSTALKGTTNGKSKIRR